MVLTSNLWKVTAYHFIVDQNQSAKVFGRLEFMMKRLSLSDFFSLLASNAVNMPGLIWNNFAVPGLIWNNFGYGQCAARIGPDHVICLI